MDHIDHTAPHQEHGGFFRSRWNLGLIVFIAVAGFYLITEHQAHLFGILPFLIFLACPLMHLFMHHGGHDGHGDQGGASGSTRASHTSHH